MMYGRLPLVLTLRRLSRVFIRTLAMPAHFFVDPQTGLPKLEHALKLQVMKQCNAAFIGDPFHIGIPLAYLMLSDFEVQDLIILIESKYFNLTNAEYRPLLLKTIPI